MNHIRGAISEGRPKEQAGISRSYCYGYLLTARYSNPHKECRGAARCTLSATKPTLFMFATKESTARAISGAWCASLDGRSLLYIILAAGIAPRA